MGEVVGTKEFSEGNTNYSTISIDKNDLPYIAYHDDRYGDKILFKYLSRDVKSDIDGLSTKVLSLGVQEGVVYSLDGNDSKYFEIDSVTGEIVFKELPDLYKAQDEDGDSIYRFTVIAQ